MSTVANQEPNLQDIVRDRRSREQWLDQAAHALFEAKKAEYPDAQPLPWDLVPANVRADYRYLVMAAYRRTLPLVDKVLVEMVAQTYANLEGYIYPDCTNRRLHEEDESARPARAAQRRQAFRHKAREMLTAIWAYLEIDCDTDAQRKITVERVDGQLQADRMVVSMYRESRGIPGTVQHG